MASRETADYKNTSQENTPFSNKSLVVEQCPSLQQLNYQGVAPIYLKMTRLFNLFCTAVTLSLLMISQRQPFFPLTSQNFNIISNIILIIGLLGLLNYWYGIVANKKKFFAIREQDITYCSGLIFQKTVTQPISRVQHVELKRGPIERKAGLACLQLFSAGGASHTFEIPGLLLENAESIRQFIVDHKTISSN